MQTFRYSIWYLAGLFAFLLLDHCVLLPSQPLAAR